MSRKKTEREYKRSFAYHFFRWLNGNEDPLIGQVEMKPQKPYQETPEEIRRKSGKEMLSFFDFMEW